MELSPPGFGPLGEFDSRRPSCMKINPLIVALVLSMLGCEDAIPVADRTTDDCHRLTLLDKESGTLVRGAEDLIQAPNQSFLIVSAYDRWAAELAASSGAAAIPQGNLYRLSLTEESYETDELIVAPLRATGDAELDFRPHGLDLLISERGTTLTVINRRYMADENAADLDWQIETTLEVFDLDDTTLTHRRTIRSELLCRANNVAALSATEFLVTRDHEACDGFGVTVENVFGLAGGKLLRVSIDPTEPDQDSVFIVAEDLAFPNGIAINRSNGLVYVATTRGQSIQVFSIDALRSGNIAKPERHVELSASPDNLAWTAANDLIIAAHPSLMRLGFYRNQWLGVDSSPSQIYSMNGDTDEIALLFDDPSGRMMSAATAAALSDNYLVVGSVADEGLLVCRPELRTDS